MKGDSNMDESLQSNDEWMISQQCNGLQVAMILMQAIKNEDESQRQEIKPAVIWMYVVSKILGCRYKMPDTRRMYLISLFIKAGRK